MEPLAVGGADLTQEVGVFAADPAFARETAGPVAAAFLDRLPDDWASGHLVLDAMLVWLQPGARMGSLAWTHEPFPGVTTGLRGTCNGKRDVAHMAMVAGPAGVDVLEGEAADAERTVASRGELLARHQRLEASRQAGKLAVRTIPPATPYRYGWGVFQRFQPAAEGGFAFWIRATRGDERPLVNGIRNAVNI
jgi:hypothetical protein